MQYYGLIAFIKNILLLLHDTNVIIFPPKKFNICVGPTILVT